MSPLTTAVADAQSVLQSQSYLHSDEIYSMYEYSRYRRTCIAKLIALTQPVVADKRPHQMHCYQYLLGALSLILVEHSGPLSSTNQLGANAPMEWLQATSFPPLFI